MQFKIIVPATSANIGPGFDISGLALELYNEFYFNFDSDLIQFTDDRYPFDTSLTLDAFFHTLDLYHIKHPKGVTLHTVSNIPIARGLGSSSSCIVAGVLAANKYGELKLTKEDLLKIATDIEGHPDNVVSAILGKFNMSLYDHEIYNTSVKLHPDLEFIAIIPPYEVKTEAARNILPTSYTLKDVQANLSRMPFIKEAFETKNKELIKLVTQDKIHEPYRKNLIKEYEDVKSLLSKLDIYAFFISGAGPTMLVCLDKDKVKPTLNHLSQNLDSSILLRHCKIDNKGAMII